jgi:DNA-binding beta-propeller fold protein YncE
LVIGPVGGGECASAKAERRVRRPLCGGLLAVLVLLVALLALAPAAGAARRYLPVSSFPERFNEEWHPSSFSSLLAQSVAVSDKNHHIYVADSGRGVIYDYLSRLDKNPARWNGSTTPKGSFGGSFLSVAVDNTTGDVYVADRTDAVIEKFDEDGNLITTFGDSSPSHDGQLAGLETPGKSFIPSTENYTSFPIAVDQATHDLYVVDPGHKVVDIFDETGKLASQITANPPGLYKEEFGATRTTGIAVTTAGNVYIADWAAHEIFQFNAAHEFVSSWNGGELPNGPSSVTPEGSFGRGGAPLELAAEDATGHVLVNNWNFNSVDTFDQDGNFIPPLLSNGDFGGNLLYDVEGIAVDQENGWLYASHNGGAVQIFRPVIVPDVTVENATEETATGVTFNGHVDPAISEGAGPVTECFFEYLTIYEYAENGEQARWRTAKHAPCSPMPSSSPTNVSAEPTGLRPGTEYRFRLVAGNEEGGDTSGSLLFGTVGAYSISGDFGSIGSGAGQLKEPEDLAVNDTTGEVFVADTGNHRVDVFSSNGAFIRAFGADVGGPSINVCTTICQAGTPGPSPGELTTPKFIEVDNSNSASAGDVYVADGKERSVQKFDPAGGLITNWRSGGMTVFPPKQGLIGGITVDHLGNLFVLTDAQPYNWNQFSPDGVSTAQWPTGFGSERGELRTPGGTGIDIGPAESESWFELQPAGNGSNGVAYTTQTSEEYSTNYLYIPLYGLQLANSGIAVNRATNDVFVDQGSWIDEFAAAECSIQGCLPSDSFGRPELNGASGLAVRPSTETLYAADTGNNRVAVFTALPKAHVTTGQAVKVGSTSGKMTGGVDPGPGGEINDCHFEYLAGGISNEIQSISFTTGTKEGTFTATFEGQTTVPVSFAAGNFTAELFQYRLEELPNIGAGNVRVTGGERGPFRIEFKGRFMDLNVPQVTTNSAGLIGPGAEAIASTKYDGNGWSYSQTASCNPAAPFSEPKTVSAELSNLTSFTTYHYRLVASRADGGGVEQHGEERVFTPTPQSPPSIDGSSVDAVTSTSAMLNAQVKPNLAPTSYAFEYGPSTTYGFQTRRSESIGEDSVDHPVSTELTNLSPGTTYHFRAVANNVNGPAFGPDLTFSTPSVPTIISTSASGVTETGATLSAGVKPGFRSTTYHFEFGRTSSYGSSTAESGPLGMDNTEHSASAAISGLAPETKYHFRIVAANEVGTVKGPDMMFTTESTPPAVRPPAAAQCKKHYVKRHGKCVKNRHHKRKRGHNNG